MAPVRIYNKPAPVSGGPAAITAQARRKLLAAPDSKLAPLTNFTIYNGVCAEKKACHDAASAEAGELHHIDAGGAEKASFRPIIMQARLCGQRMSTKSLASLARE